MTQFMYVVMTHNSMLPPEISISNLESLYLIKILESFLVLTVWKLGLDRREIS